MINPPLILTLLLDEQASRFFNELRQKHFPASRNFIDAHLTLFYALPNQDDIINTVSALSNHQAPFALAVNEVVSIGKGVAYKIESKELMKLHRELQDKWHVFLSPQDKQKLWPHITVQNKVSAVEAGQLLNELRSNFTPFTSIATGLQLWEYLNGPWKHIANFYFNRGVN